MTALASTDVTVTTPARDQDIGHGSIMKNISIVTVAFGDAALTYAAGGVPMPAIGAFGFQREIQAGIIIPALNTYKYVYDPTNNKIYISDVNGGAEFSGAPAATTLTMILIGE